jgi:hypothetical protein
MHDITIKNQQNEIVTLFKGTVYRTGKEWFSLESFTN